MLLPETKGFLLVVQRTIARTIMFQESTGQGFPKDAFTLSHQEVILRTQHPYSKE
ncbi:hypothetical protein STEG23_016060, partial [Scotinomys teguina]